MPARKPLLYDQRGNPLRPSAESQISYYRQGGFFQGAYNRNGDGGMPILFPAYADTDKLLPKWSWLQLMSSGRFLFANVPIVRGALMEQANYSFPLQAQYCGADKDWGKVASEWLYEWKKINNVRGGPFNQRTNSRVRMLGYKVDGDIGTILTSAEGNSDFPQVQYVRAHRVGSRYGGGAMSSNMGPWGDERVIDGPYKGMLCFNGCIQNDNGRTVAYRIVGATPDDDQYVSSRDMFLTFRPDYSDEIRGISNLVSCITSFSDIKRLREYEMRAQQIGASIGIMEKNDTGTVDEAAAAIQLPDPTEDVTGTSSGLIRETLESGMIRYFRSKSGNGLEAFRNDRPTADAQAFEDKIVAGALYGIEWDPNFALAIKDPGGAWARIIIQKINRAIGNNVETEAWAQRREDWYAICKAVKSKSIPAPKDGDAYSWEYHLGIPLITADGGNEAKAQRDDYKLGLTTLEKISFKNGDWWQEQRAQREAETRDLIERARGIQKTFPELTLRECIDLMEQRTPNGQPFGTPDPEGGPPTGAAGSPGGNQQ